MGRVTFEQAEKLEDGGGLYFKLSPDESKQVRFLWDRWEEVGEGWLFMVHSITRVSPDGAKYFATIDCPQSSDETAHCKYCSGEVVNSDNKKSGRVGRVVIPLFNMDENKIQYWVRSKDWVLKTLKPVLEEVNLPSLANQTFKIKRTGSGLDTSYTPIVIAGSSDNRTKTSFGEVGDPFELGIIKKYEEQESSQVQGQNQAQGQYQQPQGQYQQAPMQGQQAQFQPRRTTDIF